MRGHVPRIATMEAISMTILRKPIKGEAPEQIARRQIVVELRAPLPREAVTDSLGYFLGKRELESR